MAQMASRFSMPRSGNCRPYSPARTPTTEKPLIKGMFALMIGILPDVKPTTSSRPSKGDAAYAFVEDVAADGVIDDVRPTSARDRLHRFAETRA